MNILYIYFTFFYGIFAENDPVLELGLAEIFIR